MLIPPLDFTSDLKTFERRSGGHFFRRPPFLPGIEFSHFGAVAAKFHAAPAAVVIFAGIEKEPLAGGRRAKVDEGELVGCGPARAIGHRMEEKDEPGSSKPPSQRSSFCTSRECSAASWTLAFSLSIATCGALCPFTTAENMAYSVSRRLRAWSRASSGPALRGGTFS